MFVYVIMYLSIQFIILLLHLLFSFLPALNFIIWNYVIIIIIIIIIIMTIIILLFLLCIGFHAKKEVERDRKRLS